MGDGVNIAARLEGICRAGRDLSVRGRLSSGQGAARSCRHRSRPDPTQEHRRADPFTRFKSASPPRRSRLRRGAGRAEKRSALAPLALGIAALLILIAGSAWYLFGAGRSPPTGPRIFPSSCCPSPIFRGIPPRIISPTASPKISPPTFRASATASSSPATPPSPSRERTPTPRRSARSLACAMCSKARSSATRIGFASTRSSSTRNPARICGPTALTDPLPTFSACKTKSSPASRANWMSS